MVNVRVDAYVILLDLDVILIQKNPERYKTSSYSREESFFYVIYESHKSSVLDKLTSTTTAVAPVDDNKDFVGEYDDRRSLISVPVLISTRKKNSYVAKFLKDK